MNRNTKFAFTLAEPQGGFEFCNIKTKNAFSLAEVLITLAVIGVVAAMSVPSLVNNINNAEFHEKWRKAYSTISNATNLLIQENGGTFKGLFNTMNSAGWQEIVDVYSTKLNVVKTCDSNANIGGNCWYANSGVLNYLNGGTGDDWTTYLSHGFVLADGTSIAINKGSSPQCTLSSAGTKDDTICVYMFVDINGLKKPNTLGKDIYVLYVYENRVEPFRTTTDDGGHRCNSATGKGWGCSARWLISDKEEASTYTGEN